MTTEKPTIGEAAGLVPAAKLAEVEDARLKEATRNTQLQEDLDIKIGMVANLEADIAKEQKDRAAAEKAAKYAESECVEAKGEEAGQKREIARLEEANRALSQEVDQLRQKGSDLWESLTTSNKVRDEAVKRSEALQVEMDAARVELEVEAKVVATLSERLNQRHRDIIAIAEFLKPIAEPLAATILDPPSGAIADALASPEAQAEIERLQGLMEADEVAKSMEVPDPEPDPK